MILIHILSSWLCATGVAVVVGYNIMARQADTPQERQRAVEVAKRISKNGTTSNFKAKKRHSSAIRKMTTATVVQKAVKSFEYVSNPLYPSFMNALNRLTADVAATARNGEVALGKGFTLSKRAGRPVLNFPKAYENVCIGGLAIGEELKNGDFSVCRKRVDGTREYKVDEITLCKHRRLAEPEFYCTGVTYAAIPATRQVAAIRMYGNLNLRNSTQAFSMVSEIVKWMREDYGAVELRTGVPVGTLAMKKMRIGNGLDVAVTVNWNRQCQVERGNAHIEIAFTTRDLTEEIQCQGRELGQVVDAARICVRSNTGVDYFTVRSKVRIDDVRRKIVF